MTLDHAEVEALRSLEEAMWKAETRGDYQWMDETLASGFTEHGRSGTTYDRAAILAEHVPAEIDCVLPLPDLTVRLIEPNVALTTYTSIVMGKASNRVSVWRHDGERWRLEFHQGTAARAKAVEDPDREAFAAGIRKVTFGMGRKGYEPVQVDAFIQWVADRIDAGHTVAPDDIAEVSFDKTARGYKSKHVDAFLEGLHMRLKAD